MAWMSRLRALFRKEKLTREYDEELAFHLAMCEQLNVDEGMAPGGPGVTRAAALEILRCGGSA